MSKIKFHGKEIELSEAKTLLNKLKDGSINLELNEEERIGYNNMNEATREENEKRRTRGEKLYEEFTERKYLNFLLSIPIITQEHFAKIEACEKKGHPSEEVLAYSWAGAWCRCLECGDMYNRRMTSKENRDFNKLTQNPMTI